MAASTTEIRINMSNLTQKKEQKRMNMSNLAGSYHFKKYETIWTVRIKICTKDETVIDSLSRHDVSGYGVRHIDKRDKNTNKKKNWTTI